MNAQQIPFATKTVLHYQPYLFGFARAHTATIQDAEDLAQEMSLQLYRMLLQKTDIRNMDAYVKTLAHNTLANFYRDTAVLLRNVGADALAPIADTAASVQDQLAQAQAIEEIRSSIAQLGQLQRTIVAMRYYEGKKLSEIAAQLQLPLGTVKWHLHKAKGEIQKGQQAMQQTTPLQIQPIRFADIWFSGSISAANRTPKVLLQHTLTQNVLYSTYWQAKTIATIAQELGVVPAFVESEVQTLVTDGFLLQEGNRYLANVLIDEPSAEREQIEERLYAKAVPAIANALLDALLQSDIWHSEDLFVPFGDKNYALFSLLPYLLVRSRGEVLQAVTFEQVSTLRPDGSNYITHAVLAGVQQNTLQYQGEPVGYNALTNMDYHNLQLTQFNNDWSNRTTLCQTGEEADMLKLFTRFTAGKKLSVDEYARFARSGYCSGKDGDFALSVVWVKSLHANQRLLQLGTDVLTAQINALQADIQAYTAFRLQNTPKQMQPVMRYFLQYLFSANGYFISRCLIELLESGQLTMPEPHKRRGLCRVVAAAK